MPTAKHHSPVSQTKLNAQPHNFLLLRTRIKPKPVKAGGSYALKSSETPWV